MIDTLSVILGFVVGTLVGLSGIGGGSIMTPLLILFGVQPITAVGTDLVFNFITKLWGTVLHMKKGNVEHVIAVYLITGSFLGIGLGFIAIKAVATSLGSNPLSALLNMLIATLLITVGASQIWSNRRHAKYGSVNSFLARPRPRRSLIIGLIIGLAVQLTSIGSGSMLMPYLLRTLPDPKKVVGTDIMVGLIISLFASMAHYSLGSVNSQLLLFLVLGSLPGVTVGVALNSKINIFFLRRVLAALMMVVSVTILLKIFSVV